MEYDIIFVTGELFFDHPLCGVAILKRLLEKNGYSVGVIEQPEKEQDVLLLGKPKLFFGVTSGAIDSMVRNYTPLKKNRSEDAHSGYDEKVPDRAVTVFCNWIKKNFKDTFLIIGGTEASLRRFTHFDYWQNRLRKPILFDSRADLLVYGSAEKQILEIAKRIRNVESLNKIEGTCVISKDKPEMKLLPSFQDVNNDKKIFCDMQNSFSNRIDMAQLIDNRYMVQYKSPIYCSSDLDEYYSLPFKRTVPKVMRGFQFSVVTHRGCIGNCNFCSLKLTQGDRIISRSEESILKEIKSIVKHPQFRGNIDDLGGPSVNMYGMDCGRCDGNCIDCENLDRSHQRLISLMKKARAIPGVKNIFIKSGIRYDLATEEYVKELLKHHIFDTIRIAPEHVDPTVLKLMNKKRGELEVFLTWLPTEKVSFYFMTAHPGSSMKEAEKLGKAVMDLKNAKTVQVFTPTPMTVSTCMYYTGIDPITKKSVYVPYSYKEKKEQKKVLHL